MRSASFLLIGLAAGLLLGWLVFGVKAERADCSSSMAEPARLGQAFRETAPEPPPNPYALHEQAPVVARPPKATPPPVESRGDTGADCEDVAGPLRARVAQLEAETEEAREMLGHLGGKKLPWPEKLDPRHDQRALLDTWAEILRETGLPGDVVAIDCSEYPCMVEGRLDSGDKWQEDWRKLQDALSARADPGWHTCSTSAGHQNGEESLQFVIAHCGAAKVEADGRARIQARMRAMQRAW